jgi:hypothetical protein
MDGIDVEPRDGMHKDQHGLQALLRGAYGAASAGNGAAELSQWLQGDESSRCSRERRSDHAIEADWKGIIYGA